MNMQARTQSKSCRFLVALITAMSLALLIASCDPSDSDFILEAGKDWAREHKILNADGGVNLGAVMSRTLGVSTGDPVADTALDAGLAVKKLESADNLAQSGAETGDLKQIESAIALRPDDWSYQEQKGALLLAQGDMEEADKAFAASTILVQDHVRDYESCKFYAMNMLRHRESALLTQINRDSAESPVMVDELIARLDSVRTEMHAIEVGSPLSMCE
jgi:hypothetical protein